MPADAVVIHGHTYQPPRADPRNGVVPVEPSAAPFHDWNERIAEECYRPNAFARIFDDRGRIVQIVNNYARMSFNVGPTLAQWLASGAPDVLERMIAGDRLGRTALAQPYHHVILPLCDQRDARTELRWGAAFFRRLFGRQPEGVWLPETAIDAPTAALIAEEGYAFTVLAPGQTARHPGAGRVGVTPEGLRLAVYDGGVSHDLAFGSLLSDTAALVERLAGAAESGLMLAAVDTETFGHHHRFTERGVAHALFVEAPRRGLAFGPLAELVADAEAVDVGGVVTSAWSCAHGIERWRSDCGCASDGGPGFHQRWRAPLRVALDLLAAHSREIFERRGGEVFHDPWAARDAYGEVLADADAWPAFVETHVRPLASDHEARLLLAAQEATLASLTSCAWFFADLARREVAIVLQEAAQAARLHAALGEPTPLERAREILGEAQSNDPELPTGAEVWDWALSTPEPERPAPRVVAPLQRVVDRLIDGALASARLPDTCLEAASDRRPGDSVSDRPNDPGNDAAIAEAVAMLAVIPSDRVDLRRAQEAIADRVSEPLLAALAEALGFAPR